MLKITLDPGHGKTTNRTPLDPEFFEGASNFLFALELKRVLETYDGVTVYLTREHIGDDPSLDERGSKAVENGSDVFLSIHSNASSNPAAYGVEGFYSVTTPAAKDLLDGLCNAVKTQLPSSKIRRVTTKLDGGKDYYGVLRASEGVKYSMLIEQGFHTNAVELECLRLPEWRSTVAELQGKVFSDFFGLKKKDEVNRMPSREELIEIIRGHVNGINDAVYMLDQL